MKSVGRIGYRCRKDRSELDVERIDLNKYNLSEDLAHDRLEWWIGIHVADPNVVGTRFWRWWWWSNLTASPVYR